MANTNEKIEPISTVEALVYARKVEAQCEKTKLVNPTDDALAAIRVLFECGEEMNHAIANEAQQTHTVTSSAPENAGPATSIYKNNLNAIFSPRKDNAPAAEENEQKNGYAPK